MRDRITLTVFAAIDQLNLLLPKGEKVEKSADTVLVGDTGVLDSLGIVNFVVALESQIQSDFGSEISLIDTVTQPAVESPFQTVSTLVEFLSRRLEPGDARTR